MHILQYETFAPHPDINIPNYDGRIAAKLWGNVKNPPLVAMHGGYCTTIEHI